MSTSTFRFQNPTGSGLPAGAVVAFLTTTTPVGFLRCTGSLVNIASYNSLYTSLGTTFGGDGITTFGLPDLRSVFLRGLDESRGFDSGRGLGTFQSSSMQDHKHVYGEMAENGADVLYFRFETTKVNTTAFYSTYADQAEGTATRFYSDAATDSVTSTRPGTATKTSGSLVTSAPVTSSNSEVRPINVAVIYYIKT